MTKAQFVTYLKLLNERRGWETSLDPDRTYVAMVWPEIDGPFTWVQLLDPDLPEVDKFIWPRAVVYWHEGAARLVFGHFDYEEDDNVYVFRPGEQAPETGFAAVLWYDAVTEGPRLWDEIALEMLIETPEEA